MAQLKNLLVTGAGRVIGKLYASAFSGNGAELTSLNASNVSSGTLSADRLPTSGATAGTYGPTANQTPAYGATFNVPKVVVDNKGRVTSAASYTVKIPAAPAAGTGFVSGKGAPSSSLTSASVYVDTSVSTASKPDPAGIYIRVS